MPRAGDSTGRDVFGSNFSEYEFRVEGLQKTEFLVGAFTELFPPRLYTSNRFKLDLSNPRSPIQEATREAWDSGTVVPFTRRSVLVPGQVVPNDKRVDLNGFQFNRSGEFWGQPSETATRLSPDLAWLALESRARKGGETSTKVYFDIFSADTGRKLITIDGTFSTFGGDVDQALSKSGWLTERYFIVPLGKLLEKFMVCEFGAHGSSARPTKSTLRRAERS